MDQQGQRLKVAVSNGATVVRFMDAKILDEVAITEIGEQLNAIVKQSDSPRLVLDFSLVTHMSSSALGVLITVHKRIREKNGELRLACIQPSIYEVFVITRLQEIFHIHSSVEEALASLG